MIGKISVKNIFKREFERNDKKLLLLYGYNEHIESPAKQLDITLTSNPHMRWNPSRQEWVTYSASRVVRTSFPAKEYCPLCPAKKLNVATEIPFKNFEI